MLAAGRSVVIFLLRYVATCQYIIQFYYLVFLSLSFWELSISKVVLNTLESSLFFFYACLVTLKYVLYCSYIRISLAILLHIPTVFTDMCSSVFFSSANINIILIIFGEL